MEPLDDDQPVPAVDGTDGAGESSPPIPAPRSALSRRSAAERGNAPWVVSPDAWLRELSPADLLATVHMAAHLLHQPGWGAHGRIEGVREWVATTDLWAPPDYTPRHTPAEARALLASVGWLGVLTPLIVTAREDPILWDAGGSGARLLILDGVARWRAALRAGVWDLEVIVLPDQGPYSTTLRAVAGMTGQRAPSVLERGLGVLRLYAAYTAERELAAGMGRGLRPFPAPKELAPIVGLSPRQAARWLRVARAGEPLVGLVREGRLAPGRAFGLAALQNLEERARRAQELAEGNGD